MAEEPRAVTLEELPDLREKTENVSKFLRERLRRHLDMLRPLLAPARIFGRYVGGAKEEVTGAEDAWAQLSQKFAAVCAKPFGLPAQIEVSALESLDARLDLHPWEYGHDVGAEGDTRAITVTAPMRWILGYRSAYTPAQLRQALRPGGERKTDQIRQFLVSSLALATLLGRHEGLVRLLGDLRHAITFGPAPGLGELPLVIVDSPVRTFRPADPLVLSAVRLSGVPAFVELVDTASVEAMTDGLRGEVKKILG